MAAKGKCRNCGKTLSGPDYFHGKTRKCPQCGKTVRFLKSGEKVVEARGMCPECKRVVRAPKDYHNKVVKCPDCEGPVLLLMSEEEPERLTGFHMAYAAVMVLVAFMLAIQLIFLAFKWGEIETGVAVFALVVKILTVALLGGSLYTLFVYKPDAAQSLAIIQSIFFCLVSAYLIYYMADLFSMLKLAKGTFLTLVAVIDAATIFLYPLCAFFSVGFAISPPKATPEWMKKSKERKHDAVASMNRQKKQ